ncbi:MAG: ferrochelatase [Paludibacteraceae bacterium]
MKAILLVNMGAPVSEKEMKIFLKKMFRDKAILYAPLFVRMILSVLISNFRYKSSWKKYLQIGGSPLHKSMDEIKRELQKLLTDEYKVQYVYSYSHPFLRDVMTELYHSGITDYVVIPMYPQASFSTTGSVKADIQKIKRQFENINIRFVEDYYDNEHFITFWVQQIQTKLNENSFLKPYLLFSSHAIPQSFVDRGDLYTVQMDIAARKIATKLNLPFSVSYQSKIGKIKWTGPYTIEHLRELHNNSVNQIIIIPLSFINENLETMYDLDCEVIPFAKNQIGIKDICRIQLTGSKVLLVKMFYELIIQSDEKKWK